MHSCAGAQALKATRPPLRSTRNALPEEGIRVGKMRQIPQERQTRASVRELPLADNHACSIEQAGLMLLRAPVDSRKPD
ncbi:hypothetical protein BB934_43005 (plasmid) [Microvirga ossetica]|uniref:Uncharacterized protein n=1 Tax=Microvirga ossetica TaxID=1882682 RepID=A0A1B2EYI3_9HYPH|nr:hypothetical protein BB934_43005 [Microvirga ossetica]